MKIVLQCVLASLLFCTASVGQKAASTASPALPPLSVTISLPQTVVKAGSPVNLKITLANTSNRDLVHYFGGPLGAGGRGENVHVTDAAGDPVPETPEGAKSHLWSPNNGYRGGSAFGGRSPWKAGKTVEWEVDISKDYDLSKPGEYKVQVISHESWTVVNDESSMKETLDPAAVIPESAVTREVLKSNVITLTVTP